ncbi:small, acid-soluble spore protein, alpha/beta type [Anaerocolumna sedimenticola]|uniref:Small, acid-soluble spore protein, alpha/beta type n=1 Tax=Anaerocolumna sedimenticola TaxID=2696063 RepID=A0A6P1TGU7_9FIRM|nr:small, acid-soluble spore protein, alpha/beta type [Anaerocolumna sedimenticola]QHQ59653.1 small, acid-soluble spore protein, alpha/beta type [Anaerocolumna sedimenticola]
MSKKKSETNNINLSDLNPDEKLKYEIATELGLLDKVISDGWKSLSAKETGRIGGIMTKRKKQMQMEGINKQ